MSRELAIGLFDQPETTEPAQYVADQLGPRMLPGRGPAFDDIDVAAGVLIELIERRIGAIVAGAPESRPGLLLSGGIDSVLVAKCAVRSGMNPLALTLLVELPNNSGQWTVDAQAGLVAEHLNIEHHVVRMSVEQVRECARRCVELLNANELWEIAAAIPVVTLMQCLTDLNCTGPAFTGSGADALFLGGQDLDAEVSSTEALTEYRERSTDKVRRFFTRHRLIPDFYERLLGQNAGRYIQVFQTESFWRFTQRLDPQLLWRTAPNGVVFDKYLLRHAAMRLGIPPDLAFSRKSPLQISSGTVAALVLSARKTLASTEANMTYEDPRSEPLEHTVARLYLERLVADHG